MEYDVDSELIRQITDTKYNNMQPMAYNDLVFWQAWIGDNWEIVRLEGSEVIQMTDNKVHDISPYAYDGMVMWQTQNGDSWKTTLHDMEQDTHHYLDSSTDGVTKNPRMVLMYEAFDANGDVRVLGYDFKDKKSIPLHAIPTSVPVDIPVPEDEAEARALIQAKPSLREGDDSDDDLSLEPDLTSVERASASKATSSSDVIVEPLNDVDNATATATTSATDIIPTVDLRPASSTQEVAEREVDQLLDEKRASTTHQHIVDVVIPPLATSSDEVVG
jgi:hypothetical protein